MKFIVEEQNELDLSQNGLSRSEIDCNLNTAEIIFSTCQCTKVMIQNTAVSNISMHWKYCKQYLASRMILSTVLSSLLTVSGPAAYRTHCKRPSVTLLSRNAEFQLNTKSRPRRELNPRHNGTDHSYHH